jgi:nuclear pore complex protein Nup98-Nup96
VDAQKMHVMQTSLFRIPEEAVAIKAMNRATRSQFKLPSTVRRKHSRDSIGDGLRVDSQEVCRVSCLSIQVFKSILCFPEGIICA